MNGRELGQDWSLDGGQVEDSKEAEKREEYGLGHLFDGRILVFTAIQVL